MSAVSFVQQLVFGGNAAGLAHVPRLCASGEGAIFQKSGYRWFFVDTSRSRLAPELAPWFRISHFLAKSSESLSISRRSIIRSIIFVQPTGTQVFSR
jgi:hypothetical protein